MNAQAVYDHSIDSIRSASRLVPTTVAVDVAWPDELVSKVSDDLVDGLDSVKDAVVPAAAAAVDVGTRAAGSTTRLIRRHPAIAMVGLGAVIALVAWTVRRPRTTSSDTPSSAPVSLAA